MPTKKKRRIGRPRSTMTPEVVERILETVRLTGCWPNTAARVQGIDPAAMRKHKERHPEFVTLLEQALATAELEWHSRILKESVGTPAEVERGPDGPVIIVAERRPNWRASSWLLERRWPERWAKKEAPLIGELAVSEGGSVEIKVPDGPPMPDGGALKEWAEKLARIASDLPPSRCAHIQSEN